MKRFRGFRLGRRIVRRFKWLIRIHRKPARFLSSKRRYTGSLFNPISKITTLARKLQGRKKDYIRLGRAKPVTEVPKGHLAIYVAGSNGETRREVVPVIYFNHPLFGELLKDAEREYGYNQSGGIKLPCGYSEFERVKMRIAAWSNCTRTSLKHYKQW